MAIALLSGLLTLVGTVVVAGVGFWQWRKAYRREDLEDYRRRRVNSLESLWEAVTDIENDLRRSLAEVSLAVRHREATIQVNLTLLKSAPFLREEEKVWVTEILTNIVEIDTMARALQERGERGGGWWLNDTAPQPRESTLTAEAAFELSVARDKLAERYAAVLRGEHL